MLAGDEKTNPEKAKLVAQGLLAQTRDEEKLFSSKKVDDQLDRALSDSAYEDTPENEKALGKAVVKSEKQRADLVYFEIRIKDLESFVANSKA
jgi:hypothetical protein